jgi:zinc transporter, ZIP family
VQTGSTWWMVLPAVVIVAGGFLTFVWQPKERTISVVQHFAAGTILAALMLEVFPELTRNNVSRIVLLPAFAVGGSQCTR